MKSARDANTLTSVRLTPGENAAPTDRRALLQGLVTTGGSYAPVGGYGFIGVGGWEGDESGTPPAMLDQPVTIDGAGLTSETLSVLGGSTGGLVFRAGASSGMFAAVAGQNFFDGGVGQGDWTITMADGNDTVTATRGTNNIYAGTGRNLIMLHQGVNHVVSEGSDTITGGDDAQNTVTLMGGSSQVSLGSFTMIADMAAMGSTIRVGDRSTVMGGNSSNVSFLGNRGTIAGSNGDTISALGSLQILQGTDQTVSVAGALQFIGGTGTTSIAARMATLWGAHRLDATLSVSEAANWSGNQSGTRDDQRIDASASAGRLDAWTGAGSQTVIGGSAADQFVFGTRYEGGDGATYATVTGGSGADNMFGVLADHTAGDVTITDFGAVSGNRFFMYNYKPEDADEAARRLLATATIQGGNTQITIDSNLTVTFLGVTDLRSSQLIIS